ncbi:piezo-type mechanosensitive ion channel component 1 [Salmo salar]|uniref:Piezo-type mechanosensitive ion channel component 1 n=1 Tax=Salmo salar TaxID=8030 RepID=A0A1S3PTF5_SALSA|nr:piezo-type mechanosensitive ion channel component 1 [Salmo salar]|eukprot:XP_014030980.1 PREDICTED: piezo-type mechanosensitive ion channel component 1-like isoform X2 [Salmo salar]
MELQVVCGLLYCILLPSFLLAACLFRYNALSLVYLLYLLLLPWFLWPNKHTLRGHTGRFIKALFCTSLLFLLAHVSFQICLYTLPDLDHALGNNCSLWETLSRHVGVSRLPLDDPWSGVRLLTPDLGVFVISLVTLVVCNRLVKKRDDVTFLPVASDSTQGAEDGSETKEGEEEEEEEGDEEGISSPSEPGDDVVSAATRAKQLAARLRATAQKVLRDLGRILAITLLALAGITLPSAFSAIYFLLFIGVCTWWACHFPISHLGFNVLCVMVGFFTAGHLVCLYLYQCPIAQGIFPPASLWARLFGLKDIIKPGNCSASYDLILNTEHDWPVYVNPGILLLLYITVATVLKISSHHGSADKGEEGAQLVKGTDAGGGEDVELKPWSAQRRPSQDDTENTLLSIERKGDRVTNGSSHQDLGPGLSSSPDAQHGDHPLHLLGRVVMQQSYVCALIAMMVWSITYHSWLTFVLLLWACLIWMLRARRHFATLCSPFILLYGLALCFLQYVWAMDLQPELPRTVGTMSLRQLGLDRAQYPCLRLGAMLLYTLTFWLLLRQSVKDNFSRKKGRSAPLQEVTTGEGSGQNESVLKVVGRLVMSCYAKYWIYVCGGMFIMVSFAGKLVGYKIIYMLLFLLCLCLYQVYYSLWRRLLKVFWWLVVAYTMLVLITIYTFQFEDFPAYWKNFTGFTEEQLADIGLETFKLTELFTSILIPGFFLLACILQLHYFHKPFMRITDLDHVTPIHRKRNRHRPEVRRCDDGAVFEEENQLTDLRDDGSEDDEMMPSKWGLVMNRLIVLFRKFSDTLTQIQVLIWRVLELHILKMVAFFVVWVALGEPSVMNLVLVVLWAFAMPYTRFRHMACCLSTIWVCIIIVCKMLYQLSIVDPVEYSNNCTVPLANETNLKDAEVLNSTLYRAPVDPANWFGFRKDATVLGYSKNHLLVLMLLVFEATVNRHQDHHYRQQQRSPPLIPAIFPQATRDTLDQGLLACIKYLLNYSFYKFGLEICFLMTVNVIGQRMNFLVIIHSCWLVAIMVRRRRAAIAQIWPKYCLFLSIFMIYQYILCVGIPPALCIDYPWRWNTPVIINSALIKWIYLPDFYTIPNSKNLIADFVLLMCASQQWKVFEDEKREEWMVLAGENTDDPNPMDERPFNPAPNFINCRCYLDMAKVLVFRHMFWFVLSVVFVTGATRISVFGLGYLLACFFFLLFGTKLLRKPSRTRLVMWDCLIIYNVAVIISKNMLSILACVFVVEMQKSFCWVIQLFSLVCTVKGYYDPKSVSDKACTLPVEEAGIIWDSICFFFLLLQRRVFLSCYFLHVTADLQASARQASRGFELFRASIVKNMRFHQEVEKKSLSQLKRSMERIRSKQEKCKEGRRKSDTKADPASEPQREKRSHKRGKKWQEPWLDHAKVLHSGDYYLFESDSEEEEELFSEEKKPQKQTAFQLAYRAWVTSAKATLRERQERQKEQRRLEREERRLRKQDSSPAPGHEGSLEFEESISHEEIDDNDELDGEGSGKADIVQRILDVLMLLWIVFLAMVDGLTEWLNLITKQYVDTSTVLCNERYHLIHNVSQGSLREPMEDQLSQGSESPTMETCLGDIEGDTDHVNRTSATSGLELVELSERERHSGTTLCCSEPTLELLGVETEPQHRSRYRHSRTASEMLTDRQFFVEELVQCREFYSSQNRLLKLQFALYNLLAANSELVCYFIVVLNNMVTASVISVVLPILIFLWAMLAVPRPTKKFWMTAIVYTEVMVVVKYLFQFGFFPWNSVYELTLNEDKPFFPPRILGLEKTDNYIRYDLLQLLALFFHRSLLQRYGLWDQECALEEKPSRPSEEANKKKEEGEGEGVEVHVQPSPGPSLMDLEELKPDEDQKAEPEPEPEPSTSLAPTPEPPPSLPVEGPKKKGSIMRFRKKKQLSKEALDIKAEKKEQKKKQKGKRREAASKKLIAVGEKIKHLTITAVWNVYKPCHEFFSDILHAPYRAATDVYALMFLTDVVDFIIIVFGFWAFGKHSAAADIASTLSEDQVPEAFLVMLLIQFSTMIIDRALYLRKTVLGKLIFQIILVFGIHLWMFFILPAVTERMFSQNSVAQLWYFFKCIYFALSAYQIRCGYPTRILGNFLTKKFNHLNLFLFQGFRLVPFLVELRAVMDWVWTDTTLSLSNWMCVEDIYANIFIIKCSRETEKKYPQPKGQKKKKIVKYGMGGLIIFFLICIIWFPLLFISLVRSVVGVVNHPVDVTVTVKLGGYEPLFTMSVQQQSIQSFTEEDYNKLTTNFYDNARAMQFITLYSYEDIVTAKIKGSSGSVWRISPPSRQEVVKELLGSTVDMTLRLAWTFQRDLGKGGTVEHTSDKYSIDLDPGNPVRADLASLLVGNRTDPVRVPHMFPNYIRAPNGAEAKPVDQLYKGDEEGYQDVTLSLMRDRSLNSTRGAQEWWDISIADCPPSTGDCGVLPMVIFNDKVSPPSLGFLAGYGIMGLYVSVVLVIGKFVRGFFSEISHSIMFEELPCVNRILKLCTDIFLVRETGELELEEELYSKLIFLYRSPETMIKWTRDKLSSDNR